MDLSARRVLDEVICERRKQGRTAILVSHRLGDVQRLCDRVAVLREGRMAFLGSVDALIDSAERAPTSMAPIATTNTSDALRSSDAGRLFEEALEPLYSGAGR